MEKTEPIGQSLGFDVFQIYGKCYNICIDKTLFINYQDGLCDQKSIKKHTELTAYPRTWDAPAFAHNLADAFSGFASHKKFFRIDPTVISECKTEASRRIDLGLKSKIQTLAYNALIKQFWPNSLRESINRTLVKTLKVNSSLELVANAISRIAGYKCQNASFQWFRAAKNCLCTESRMLDENRPRACLLGCRISTCNHCEKDYLALCGSASSDSDDGWSGKKEYGKGPAAMRRQMAPHLDECADSQRHYFSCRCG